MSMQYCEQCDTIVDTDFNAEHFDEEVGGCETTAEMEAQAVIDNIDGFNKQTRYGEWLGVIMGGIIFLALLALLG